MVANNSDEALADLRSRIEQVDRKFAQLLIARQQLVREIAERKMEIGIPLRNYTVESQVLDRFARFCRENGVTEKWGIDLANLLINKSVELQSNMLERRNSAGRMKVLVVGGLGKMGRWMCSFLDNQGHDVFINDPATGPSLFNQFEDIDDGLAIADMIIVSVPLEDSASVLEQILSRNPKGVVFDLCSLKKRILPMLRKGVAAGLKITSLHPLFGPETATLYGKNIIICSCGNEAADEMARSLFSETAANVLALEPEEHDRLMTMTLGLSHALNLIFARTLTASGESFPRLRSVASSTFSKQLSTTLDVVNENMQLYFEIQRQCDHTAIYESMQKELRALKSAVEEDLGSTFLEAMDEAVQFFGDHTTARKGAKLE